MTLQQTLQESLEQFLSEWNGEPHLIMLQASVTTDPDKLLSFLQSSIERAVEEERSRSYKQGGLDCISMIAENGEGMTWENRKARERLWVLMWDDLLTTLKENHEKTI